MQHVLSTLRHFAMNQTRNIFEIGINANIDNMQFSSMKTRQNAHCSASPEKVQNHLIGDLARVGADAPLL